MLEEDTLVTASDRLYFAYGSNLSPERMARRCPDSIFLGKATLRGYKWQINERGVANIVADPAEPAPREKKAGRGNTSSRRGRPQDRDEDDHHAAEAVVEGLVYAVSEADERRLDRYEGVEKGWYEKFAAQLDFEPVRGNVFARCTSATVARALREEREDDRIADALGILPPRARTLDASEKRRSGRRDGAGRRGASVSSSSTWSSSSSSTVAMGGGGLRNSILGLLGIPSKTGRSASPSPTRGRETTRRPRGTPVSALVYASTVYVSDGDVRNRYVRRMRGAVDDAMALGVSREFVEKHIAPVVPEVLGTRPARKSSRRVSLAGGKEDLEKDRRRLEVESAKRRSASTSDRLSRHGRRDSILDRSRDSY